MLDYFRTNLKYRILAVILAIAIWLFVFEKQNPTQENVINVPLEVRELSEGLVINEKPGSVNVRIKGRKEVIEKIGSRDLSAYVNMSTANIGKEIYQVYINLPQGVKKVEVSPKNVEIEVDAVTSVQIPVDVQISGTPDTDYKLGTPRLTPEEVMVLGPKKVLEDIEKAYLDIKISQTNDDYIKTLPVKLQNKGGRIINHEWVECRPESVEVFLPVIKDNPTRIVPVTYKLKGSTAKGYKVKNINMNPEVVKVSSSNSQKLYETNYIPVEINLNNSKKDLTVTAPLKPPEGVKVINASSVTIIVDIAKK